jgi:hypothetical protein
MLRGFLRLGERIRRILVHPCLHNTIIPFHHAFRQRKWPDFPRLLILKAQTPFVASKFRELAASHSEWTTRTIRVLIPIGDIKTEYQVVNNLTQSGEAIRWLASEHGRTTLDYFGGLLVGTEIFATILGEKRAEKIKDTLARLREKLNPKNAKAMAKYITFGPVAAVAMLLAMGLFIWIVIWEIRNFPGADYFSEDDSTMVKLWKGFWSLLFKPLACLGLLAGVYFGRSEEAKEEFTRGMKEAGKVIWRSTVANVSSFGSLLMLALWAGFYAGVIFMAFIFYTIEVPLKFVGFILEQNLLRRIAACAGLAMLTLSYILGLEN